MISSEDEVGAAVTQLGDLSLRPAAVRVIVDAGASAISALRVGVSHPYWRVRHMACRLLDDLPLDPDILRELQRVAATDPHRKVRAQAYHAAGCEPCKPHDAPVCLFDRVAMLLDGIFDRSLRVRRQATTGLMFEAILAGDVDARVVEALAQLAADADPIVRRRAQRGLRSLGRVEGLDSS